MVRPGWSWRAHARRSPTHTDVYKVIRSPRLPSCGQLGLHEDTITDNPTFFQHCRARTPIRAVGPRTLPRVCSGITCRILPGAARSNLVLALREPPRDTQRVQPCGCSATQRPFLELRATPPEVPQLVRVHFPCPSPVSKMRSGARGAPTSLQCPEGRGAARRSGGAGL